MSINAKSINAKSIKANAINPNATRSDSQPIEPPEVAICILYTPTHFLMQLRDNDPRILYPGYWALFGGHIEAGETPAVAVVREVAEEIDYALPATVRKVGIYPDALAIRHVFASPLEVELTALTLNEGWDMGLLTLDEIISGTKYSAVAQEQRPIGPIHQRILQEFSQSRSA
jgi:8-oxo-dGTP diphosphatase